jgi:MFS family permease
MHDRASEVGAGLGAGSSRASIATSANPASDRAPLLYLTILGAVVFLTALDQTMVVTALLPMAQSLGLTPQDLSALSWVISGYLLGYVIVMPLMGRVADIWGRLRLMVVCLAIFAGGSLFCVEAPHLAMVWDMANLTRIGIHVEHPALTWLIVARFLQAVGGGAVVPIALASSGALFGSRRRSVALGFIAGVTEAGGALGPLYGAIILEKWSITWSRYPEKWMWLFLLNVPFVVVLIILLWLSWPSRARPGNTEEMRDASSVSTTPERSVVDWLGAIILGGALVCLSLGLSQQAGAMIDLSAQQEAAHNLYLLAAAGLLFLAFIVVESRQRSPLIPLQFFRSGTFSASALLSFIIGIVLIVALVNVPIFAYAVLAETHLGAGLILLRLTFMIPIGAFVGGWLTTRSSARIVGIAAAIVIAIGFFLMSHWTPDTSRSVMTMGTVVTGLGFGLVLSPISTTALQTIRATQFGIAAAISTTMRMVGMIVGLAVLSSWEIGRFHQIAAKLRAIPAGPNCDFGCQAIRLTNVIRMASSQAMAETFLIAAGIAALAILPALWLRTTEEV